MPGCSGTTGQCSGTLSRPFCHIHAGLMDSTHSGTNHIGRCFDKDIENYPLCHSANSPNGWFTFHTEGNFVIGKVLIYNRWGYWGFRTGRMAVYVRNEKCGTFDTIVKGRYGYAQDEPYMVDCSGLNRKGPVRLQRESFSIPGWMNPSSDNYHNLREVQILAKNNDCSDTDVDAGGPYLKSTSTSQCGFHMEVTRSNLKFYAYLTASSATQTKLHDGAGSRGINFWVINRHTFLLEDADPDTWKHQNSKVFDFYNRGSSLNFNSDIDPFETYIDTLKSTYGPDQHYVISAVYDTSHGHHDYTIPVTMWDAWDHMRTKLGAERVDLGFRQLHVFMATLKTSGTERLAEDRGRQLYQGTSSQTGTGVLFTHRNLPCPCTTNDLSLSSYDIQSDATNQPSFRVTFPDGHHAEGLEYYALDSSSSWSATNSVEGNQGHGVQFTFNTFTDSKGFAGIVLQARKNVNQYVTKFKVKYTEGSTTEYLKWKNDKTNQETEFFPGVSLYDIQSSTGYDTKRYVAFSTLRYPTTSQVIIKIEAWEWVGHPSMRVGVLRVNSPPSPPSPPIPPGPSPPPSSPPSPPIHWVSNFHSNTWADAGHVGQECYHNDLKTVSNDISQHTLLTRENAISLCGTLPDCNYVYDHHCNDVDTNEIHWRVCKTVVETGGSSCGFVRDAFPPPPSPPPPPPDSPSPCLLRHHLLLPLLSLLLVFLPNPVLLHTTHTSSLSRVDIGSAKCNLIYSVHLCDRVGRRLGRGFGSS